MQPHYTTVAPPGHSYLLLATCSNCKEQKPLSAFPANRNECRACLAAYLRRYRKKRTEEDPKYGQQYNYTIRAMYARMKYAARRRNISFSLNLEEFTELRALPCTYCGGELEVLGFGMDRKDNTEGYTSKNTVPCCFTCNAIKSSIFTFEEMMEIGVIIHRIRGERGLPIWNGKPPIRPTLMT